MIAHVSAIFLLPVYEKSVIIDDFRAIAHSISAQEGGNTVCCNAMIRNRTDDDSVTYWFPWKHHMARRRGLEFGVFDQTPPKTSSSARPFGPHLSSIANAPRANFSPFRCPPRGLGHAALDSDHAECWMSDFVQPHELQHSVSPMFSQQIASTSAAYLLMVDTGGRGSTGRFSNQGRAVTFSSNTCPQRHTIVLLHSHNPSHMHITTQHR